MLKSRVIFILSLFAAATLAVPTAPAVAQYRHWQHRSPFGFQPTLRPLPARIAMAVVGSSPANVVPVDAAPDPHYRTLSRRCARAEVDWPLRPRECFRPAIHERVVVAPERRVPIDEWRRLSEPRLFVSRRRFSFSWLFVSRSWFVVSRRWRFIPQHRFIKRFRISILRNTLHLHRRWYGLLRVQRAAEYFLREPLSLWGG